MTMGRFPRILSLCLVLAAAACSGLPRDFETPKFSITNIAPRDISLMEQRFEVQLRIQNPNTFDLGLNGIRFELSLNGKEFGSGMSGAAVTVPRFSSEVITGEMITGLGSLLRQAQGLGSETSKFQYRVKGKAFAEAPGRFTIPFDESGEFDMQSAAQPER